MLKLVVLSCVLAAGSASALGYGVGLAPLAYAAPLYQPHNYRGPLSLAPGQPADILASDGRPLDTLEVNQDRAAHYTAKALDNGFHLLKKRSAAFIAPYAARTVLPYAASYVAPLAYSTALLQPYNYRGPLSLAPGQPASILGADGRPLDTLDVNLDRSAHLTAKALSGAHILKKRSAVVAPVVAPVSAVVAPVSAVAVARAPLIASPYAYAAPWAPYRTLSYAAPYAHFL